MESICSPILLLAFLATLYRIFLYILNTSSSPAKCGGNARQIPPGPPTLPIIGNMHLLGFLPHRALQKLAKTYGPIMSIKLGRVPAIIVSSPEVAKEFLSTHDEAFACRPQMLAPDQMTYGSKGMIFTKYGTYYRSVKKVCHSNLLNRSKVDEMRSMRREEVGILVEKLSRAAMAGEVVDLSAKVNEVVQSMTFRMILGTRKDDRFDLQGIIKEVIALTGAINLADYLPTLPFLDLQGMKRRLKRIGKKIDEMLETIFEEHEEESFDLKEEEKRSDFVDSLLISMLRQPMNPQDGRPFMIGRENIKSIALEIITAAISTSPTAIDWTFSELLRHPRVMKLAQQELENVVGMDRMVEETDLPKLHYLDMVMKEAFRLNPIAPLLIPRESMEDKTVNGYFIPRETRVFVNTWAMGRDPSIWSENVLEFYPERFYSSSANMVGKDFEFMPFGAGRRGCPGINVGLVTVKLVVAQLVHCFDWNLPRGVHPQDIDMSEKFGVAMTRAKHLLALPTKRLHCLSK